MRNGMMGAIAALLGVGLFAFAQTARSDEIKVMASVAVKETYLELVPQFEKASGHKVVTIWSGTADMMKRLKEGESVDLVIIGTNSLERIGQSRRVRRKRRGIQRSTQQESISRQNLPGSCSLRADAK